MLLSFFESMILHLFSISKCGSVVLLHEEYGHSVSQNVFNCFIFCGAYYDFRYTKIITKWLLKNKASLPSDGWLYSELSVLESVSELDSELVSCKVWLAIVAAKNETRGCDQKVWVSPFFGK